MLNTLKRYPLLTFYILAFFTAWCIKIPVSLSLTNNIILRLLPSFLPALAAMGMVAIVAGKRGVTGLLKQITHLRISPFWYIIALAGPMVLELLSVALAAPFGSKFPGVSFPGIRLLPTFIIAIFFALGEEVGWRGFAQPRFQRRFNALTASLFVGLLWWLWHLPEILAGSGAGLSLSQYISLEAWSLLQMLALSIIMTWLYNSTGKSVFLAALFHVGVGLLGQILSISNGSLTSNLTNVLLCIAAILVVVATEARDLTYKKREDPKLALEASTTLPVTDGML